MWIADNWKDYEILDTSGGEKLERWGQYTLVRPDPQIIWNTPKNNIFWRRKNAHYKRSKSGGGSWDIYNLPQTWSINYGKLSFLLKPFGFKHTGLFPEQATNWDWMSDLITKSNRPIKVLNLFAYTGGATLACLSSGASVTHVDASRGMVSWAKENANASSLSHLNVRWLVDDCIKFIKREIRRENKYDAIIMDPPSYGRGPNGEVWKIEDTMHDFFKDCVKLLSDKPLFMLINSYTTGLAGGVMTYLSHIELDNIYKNVIIESEEIGLPISNTNLTLPCGISTRIKFK